tara:strand:- start:675 stop:851 length:177 start_codon:yes stop_codon:yes gene_type:complete
MEKKVIKETIKDQLITESFEKVKKVALTAGGTIIILASLVVVVKLSKIMLKDLEGAGL